MTPPPESRRVDDAAVERAVTGDLPPGGLGVRDLEAAIRRLWAQRLSDLEIARRLHTTARTVLRVRQRLNLPTYQPQERSG